MQILRTLPIKQLHVFICHFNVNPNFLNTKLVRDSAIKHHQFIEGTAAPLQPFCTILYSFEYICSLCFNLNLCIVGLDGPPASVTCGLIEEFLNDYDVKYMYHRLLLLKGRQKILNVLLLRRYQLIPNL